MSYEAAKRIVIQTLKEYKLANLCQVYTLDIARRATEEGFDVQIMRTVKHWWVEEVRDDGLVLDAYPLGMGRLWTKISRHTRDKEFLITQKGSGIAKKLYKKSKRDDELTIIARSANDKIFYETMKRFIIANVLVLPIVLAGEFPEDEELRQKILEDAIRAGRRLLKRISKKMEKAIERSI